MRLSDFTSMKKLKSVELNDVKIGGEVDTIERYSDQNGTVYELDARRGLFRVFEETGWQNIDAEINSSPF